MPRLLLFSFFMLSFLSCISTRWSTYQGKLIWEEANSRCKEMGMYLPTIQELKKAYENGSSQGWEDDSFNYWSSTPFYHSTYAYLVIYNGKGDSIGPEKKVGVRCKKGLGKFLKDSLGFN